MQKTFTLNRTYIKDRIINFQRHYYSVTWSTEHNSGSTHKIEKLHKMDTSYFNNQSKFCCYRFDWIYLRCYYNNSFTGWGIALNICLITWNKCQKEHGNFKCKGKQLSVVIFQISPYTNSDNTLNLNLHFASFTPPSFIVNQFFNHMVNYVQSQWNFTNSFWSVKRNFFNSWRCYWRIIITHNFSVCCFWDMRLIHFIYTDYWRWMLSNKNF